MHFQLGIQVATNRRHERLDQDIYNSLTTVSMMGLGLLREHYIRNKMSVNLNVLHLLMEHRIVNNMNGSLVVTHEGDMRE